MIYTPGYCSNLRLNSVHPLVIEPGDVHLRVGASFVFVQAASGSQCAGPWGGGYRVAAISSNTGGDGGAHGSWLNPQTEPPTKCRDVRSEHVNRIKQIHDL